jgi:uncharacterized protein YndB with AHSA1/START domain
VRGSATMHMDASAQSVWQLISDVTQIGRFSPETFEARWLDDVTGPTVGAKFRGHVKRNEKGPIYWTHCTVTECQPGETFASRVKSRPLGLPIAPSNTVQVTWRYDISPSVSGGVDVTESFELRDIPRMRLYWRALGWVRGPRMRRDWVWSSVLAPVGESFCIGSGSTWSWLVGAAGRVCIGFGPTGG